VRKERWLLALVALTGLAALAAAQGPFFPNPYYGGGIVYSRGRLSVGFGFRGVPIDPYGGPYFSRRTYFSVYAPPPPPPPIIVINPPPEIFEVPSLPPRLLPPVETPPAPDIPPVPEVPPVPDVPPMPGEPVPLPPAPKPKDRPKKEKPKDDGEPRLPGRAVPLDDAVEEAARQVLLGREEFAGGQYGRAAGRFRRAMELKPGDTLTPFLLAQALLAMGKYHEASDVLVPALRAAPDWPRAAFRPLDVYGAAVTEYSDHLRLLDETRARHPEDPVLQFLAGYQLWFDGRRDEAVRLFRLAEPHFADLDAIERFLRAAPSAGAI
jgi:hypothetical protein